MDNLSNESSINSSGFHSKSTTTTFNNEYSPRLAEIADYTFSGIKEKLILCNLSNRWVYDRLCQMRCG
jgi:hypothetical protein